MTDSTLLKRGQGNGDGVSVYICRNECQKMSYKSIKSEEARKEDRREGKRHG